MMLQYRKRYELLQHNLDKPLLFLSELQYRKRYELLQLKGVIKMNIYTLVTIPQAV